MTALIIAFGGFILGSLFTSLVTDVLRQCKIDELNAQHKKALDKAYTRGYTDGRENNDDHIRALHDYCDYWHNIATGKTR